MIKINYINNITTQIVFGVFIKSTYYSLNFISSILYHYSDYKFTSYKYIGICNDIILKAHNLEALNHKSIYLNGAKY